MTGEDLRPVDSVIIGRRLTRAEPSGRFEKRAGFRRRRPLYEAHYQGDGDMEQQRPERRAKNKSQQPHGESVDGDARQFGIPRPFDRRALGVHSDIPVSGTDIWSVHRQIAHDG
jgi:hypothetical protein